MGDIRTLPGARPPPTAEPNPAMVSLFTDLLEMAKDGRLQSFAGTGFTSDGNQIEVWADHHPSYYEMLGALEALKLEFVERRKA